MRIVFFGTPSFAASILQRLVQEGFSIPLVVSKEDKMRGRSSSLVPTEVKSAADALGIEVLQPQKTSDPEFVEKLKALEPDLFVVVAYGEILKESVLSIPKIACINVHASLLPKYRGASPIQQVILEGEKETGVTIMHMVKRMDAGNVIAKESLLIGAEETYGELEQRLCSLGSDLLVKVLSDPAGIPQGTPQEEGLASYVKKILQEDALLDFSESAKKVHQRVCAMSPKPGAYIEMVYKGISQRIKLYHSRLSERVLKPKEILIEGKQLFIGCGDGKAVELLELQLPGKKKVEATAFILGLQGQSFHFP